MNLIMRAAYVLGYFALLVIVVTLRPHRLLLAPVPIWTPRRNYRAAGRS
jgi:hypothetical protein